MVTVGEETRNSRLAWWVEVGMLVAWVALGVVILIATQGMRAPANRFPALIAWSIIGLSVILAMRIVRGEKIEYPAIQRKDAMAALVFFISLWVYTAAVGVLGIPVASFVWSFAVLMGVYRWKWQRAAVSAFLFAVMLATVFPALGLRLPSGAWFG